MAETHSRPSNSCPVVRATESSSRKSSHLVVCCFGSLTAPIPAYQQFTATSGIGPAIGVFLRSLAMFADVHSNLAEYGSITAAQILELQSAAIFSG